MNSLKLTGFRNLLTMRLFVLVFLIGGFKDEVQRLIN
jgi:hypothetical protein